MKAISVKQPWATLIIDGVKDIENRTWECPQRYIGQRVLIHTGKSPIKYNTSFDLFTKEQQLIIPKYLIQQIYYHAYVLGAIIGSVEIVDCVINHDSIWAEKSSDSEPIYNWVLNNPIKFKEPISCKGALSFWEFNGELPKDKD